MGTEFDKNDNIEDTGQESVQPEQPEQDMPAGEAGTETGASAESPSGEGTTSESAAEDNGAGESAAEGAAAANQSAAGRVVNVAKEQASEAAEAFRKGEFMQDPSVDEEATNDDRLIAMLSYASQIFLPLVMPIIVLISESSKKRPFQRYHAVQSLALMVVMLAVGLGAFVGLAILSALPLIGAIFGLFWLLFCCLTPLIFLMAVTSLGFYGYQAYQGKRFSIPGLTSFLKNQGWVA